MCVCITMYNEDEDLFKVTLSGVIQNYNVMAMDEKLGLSGQDMVVCLVCDGFDKIPEEMKAYMKKYKLFDERILLNKGYMKEVKGKWKLKPIDEIMHENIADDKIMRQIGAYLGQS